MLKVIGVVFVILAALGAVLPILPTTPFLLVAASCFAKSSPRLYLLLLNNKVFGPIIINWQSNRSIPKRAKIISLLSMLCAGAYSFYMLDNIWLKGLTFLLMLGPFIFVARLPLSKGNPVLLVDNSKVR